MVWGHKSFCGATDRSISAVDFGWHSWSLTSGGAVSALDCYAGGLPFESDILPLLKHAHVHGEQWLATLLAVKRSAGVTPVVNIYHACLCQVQVKLPTMALKPREDDTRSPKQVASKRTCVRQKLKKKDLGWRLLWVLKSGWTLRLCSRGCCESIPNSLQRNVPFLLCSRLVRWLSQICVSQHEHPQHWADHPASRCLRLDILLELTIFSVFDLHSH